MDKKVKNKSHLEAETEEPKKKKNPVADKVLEQFMDISRYQAKRESLLLGDFSSDGKYSLSDEKLMQDLVSMPKVLQEKVDDVVYAHTKYNGYNLNFKIELDISESYCSAEMYLIEIEHRPDEDIKHLTSLGNFVEMYSPNFRENVYKTWNINLQETPLDKDDIVFKNLKNLDGELAFSKELLEILSQLYIVRLLKLLDGCGTLGLKIQGDYRALVEELIKKDPSLAQDHTRLKHILDQMIAKHNGYDVILSKPDGIEILKNFSEPISRVTGKSGPILVENGGKQEEKPAEKPAEKKSAPKKKKSKAKGGDSVKPFVWAIKNYKPQVLTTSEEAKKILPSKENPSPIAQTTPRGEREDEMIAAEPPLSTTVEGVSQTREQVRQNRERSREKSEGVSEELGEDVETFAEHTEDLDDIEDFIDEDSPKPPAEQAEDFEEEKQEESKTREREEEIVNFK